MSNSSNMAILGASGHIGKNLVLYFSKDKKYKLFLFSRNEVELNKIINNLFSGSDCFISNYNSFNKFQYDIIINCTGISDPYELQRNDSLILGITDYYDNTILDYLSKNPSSFYINISSGAVYGEEFISPAEDSTVSKLHANNPTSGYFYSIAKIYSEAKHRTLKESNIVDLRLFGFFSRFIDLNAKFFMSELVSTIKNNAEFLTHKIDFMRDFVHPKDLCVLIEKCIDNKPLNDAFDVYSKAPVSKFEILKEISQKYGLRYNIEEKIEFAYPTETKKNYYSLSRKAKKIGYNPQFSSIETILSELEHILVMRN